MSYEDLLSLPRINGVTVIGNKTFREYGLIPMTSEEIADIMFEVFGYVL